jgi:hypothetical protein
MFRPAVVRRSMFSLVAVMSLLAATPALAGPPWISIEVPPNPHDRTTRGAFLVVHAFHHGNAVGFPVIGTAEGLVRGKRQTIPLAFDRTSRDGSYALRKQWPSEGTWMLVISVAPGGEDNRATALVELSRSGEVASVRVPSEQRDGWTIPRQVTAREVDAALQTRAAATRVAGRTGR